MAPEPADASTGRVRFWLDRWDLNPLGAGFVLIGAVLVLAAFTVLNWFRAKISFPGSRGTTFSEVHDFLEATRLRVAADGIAGYFSFGAAGPYFSWLGWLLLVLAVAASLVATSRSGRDHWSLRWLGAVVCAAGAGITFMALDLVIPQGNPPGSLGLPDYSDYLTNTAIGAWAALAGFVAMLIGCLVPRRDS